MTSTRALYDGNEILSEAQVYDRAAAYRKLVDALRKANQTFRDMQGVHEALGRSQMMIDSARIPAESGEALLRELGE